MRITFLSIALFTLMMGCDSSTATDEVVAEDAILGTWTRTTEPERAELTLHMQGSGNYDITYSTLTRAGQYEFNTNGLLLVRDAACGNFEGVYSLTFSDIDQVVILGLVEDRCQIREERWRGTWRRVSATQ